MARVLPVGPSKLRSSPVRVRRRASSSGGPSAHGVQPTRIKAEGRQRDPIPPLYVPDLDRDPARPPCERRRSSARCSRATTITKPIPMLKVWYISSADRLPSAAIHGKRDGPSGHRSSTKATRGCRRTGCALRRRSCERARTSAPVREGVRGGAVNPGGSEELFPERASGPALRGQRGRYRGPRGAYEEA